MTSFTDGFLGSSGVVFGFFASAVFSAAALACFVPGLGPSPFFLGPIPCCTRTKTTEAGVREKKKVLIIYSFCRAKDSPHLTAESLKAQLLVD